MKQKGQIILILILIMTVALGIGLTIVQKSLVDLSTASKVDQSSRAFSAAEAGVEKALKESATTNHIGPSFTDTSSKVKEINDTGLIPCVPGSSGCKQSGVQDALEYPPLAKEDIVQVWLADPNANLPNCASPSVCYTQPTLEVYWGTWPQSGNLNPDNKPAIEIKVVYYDNDSLSPTYQTYQSKQFYLDSNSSRTISNGFIDAFFPKPPVLSSNCNWPTIVTTSGSNRQFYCKSTLGSLNSNLMLMRVRFLYSPVSQPFAVQAVGTCNPGCSLPPQARSIESTGVAGETQRKVRLFQENKVVPPFFDYAIFSAGQISKN